MKTATHPLVDIYEPLGVVGSGRFGQVIKAKDQEEQVVAVKRIRLDNWDDIKRLERESEALKRLNNPHIPRFIEYYETEDPIGRNPEYVLAMEFIEGDNLSARLRREKFDEERVKKIRDETLEALAEAHSKDVIHRDIKPKNILIRDEDNRTFITDFGFAKLADNSSGMSSLGAGTLAYQAPEQLGLADYGITEATDYYSLGLTLVALLTGKEREKDIVHQDPLKDLEKVTNISPGFRKSLQYLLSSDPKERVKGLRDVEEISDVVVETINYDENIKRLVNKFKTHLTIGLMSSIGTVFNAYIGIYEEMNFNGLLGLACGSILISEVFALKEVSSKLKKLREERAETQDLKNYPKHPSAGIGRKLSYYDPRGDHDY